jgi:hypothetical protein
VLLSVIGGRKEKKNEMLTKIVSVLQFLAWVTKKAYAIYLEQESEKAGKTARDDGLAVTTGGVQHNELPYGMSIGYSHSSQSGHMESQRPVPDDNKTSE